MSRHNLRSQTYHGMFTQDLKQIHPVPFVTVIAVELILTSTLSGIIIVNQISVLLNNILGVLRSGSESKSA